MFQFTYDHAIHLEQYVMDFFSFLYSLKHQLHATHLFHIHPYRPIISILIKNTKLKSKQMKIFCIFYMKEEKKLFVLLFVSLLIFHVIDFHHWITLERTAQWFRFFLLLFLLFVFFFSYCMKFEIECNLEKEEENGRKIEDKNGIKG